MKKLTESNTLVILTALKTTIETFAGPFLAAYFVSSTMESLSLLVKYYIILYTICAVISPLVAGFGKRGKLHRAFSLGIMFGFFSILFIVIMKEKLPSYYYLLALLYGIGEQFFYYPFNIFVIEKVEDEEREKFENSRVLATKITAILIPVILGGIISSSDFPRTAIIILFLSAAMVGFSFNIKKVEYSSKLDFKSAFKALKKTESSRSLMLFEFTQGMYGILTGFVFPALVFMNNRSNTGLGFITSLSSLLFVGFQIIYVLIKLKHDSFSNVVLWVCPFLSVIPLVVYCVKPGFITIVVAYVMYTVFQGIYMICGNAIRFSSMHHEQSVLGHDELLIIREAVLALGRCLAMIVFLVFLKVLPSSVPYVFMGLVSIIIVNSFIVRKMGLNCLKEEL